MIRTIEELLAPVHIDAVTPEPSLPRFVHIAGADNKFDGLFSWSDLNRILDEYEFDHPRLRLVKNGETVPRAHYSMTDPFTTAPSVDSLKLMGHLSAGATLVVNMIERMTPSLWDLTLSIERELCSRVFITAYAGWKLDNGFALHYDNDDTFILQIHGRKHWTVYEPTRAVPIWNDVGKGPKPDTKPVWEGLVNPGDVLFIPRGWWHLAAPINEPCMHLTFGLVRLKGVELLSWLFDNLKAQQDIRTALPLMKDSSAQTDWARTIRNHLLAACDDDLIARFIREREARCPIRAPYRFPQLADEAADQNEEPTCVRLVGRRLQIVPSESNSARLEIKTGGIEIPFDHALLPALQMLNDGKLHSLIELSFGITDTAETTGELSAILHKLHRAGTVVIGHATPLSATIR